MTTMRMGGVDLAVVNREHITRVMEDLHLEVDDDDEVKTLVARLSLHFSNTCDDEQVVPCDCCGGLSDRELDACPFCGEDDNTSSSSSESEEPAGSALAPQSKGGAMETGMTKVNGKGSGLLSGQRNEGDLDKAVHEVQRLKADGAAAYWRIGGAVRRIYDSQLWKQRNDEQGKPRYKGFDAFCSTELGITPQHAYSLIGVSKEFSEADVRKWGSTKLGLILQAPREDQKMLKAKLAEGVSKRELQEEVKESKARAGGFQKEDLKPANPTGKQTPGKHVKRVAPKNAGRRGKYGQLRVKVDEPAKVGWLAAPTKRGQKLADCPPATRMTDAPACLISVGNGLVLHLKLRTKANGQFESTYVWKYEDAE